jgi:hypothetical protein
MYPFWLVHQVKQNKVFKRFFLSLSIGGSSFPSPCIEVAANGSGSLIVSENTTSLKVWTYADETWTAQTNITKDNRNVNISKSATITPPSYDAKKK